MKMFPKMQDDTIDRLLRAQGGAAAKGLPPCREFDADLASAYVERSLKESERASYESHLAACSPCRKTIIALTRMAASDPVAAPAIAAAVQARGASGIRQWLGALTVPQWAMAAAAVMVLAITLPLALSHRATPTGDSEVVAVAGPPPGDVNAKAMAQSNATNETANPNSARDANAQSSTGANEKSKPEAKKEAQPTDAVSDVNGGATALAQSEPKSAEQAPPPAKVEASTQPSPAPAAEPTKPQATDEAKNQTAAKEEAKDNKQDKKRAEPASDQAGTIAPPPPPPTRGSEPARRERDDSSASVPGIQAFRDPSEAAAATSSVSRKISGHQFFFRAGVWTDKEYKPDKDKPVTIIRDSDVYHSLLARDAKIEPFLKGFPNNARVIFKFKGTAYKLVPQDADK
jgi:hypothetical protein